MMAQSSGLTLKTYVPESPIRKLLAQSPTDFLSYFNRPRSSAGEASLVKSRPPLPSPKTAAERDERGQTQVLKVWSEV